MRKCAALLAACLMLAGCAGAESLWGIVSFMEENGYTPAEENVLRELAGENIGALVNVRVEEALCQDEKLFLALTAMPQSTDALVVPWVMDIAGDGSLAVMDHADYDAGLSVAEYARQQGYAQVITLQVNMLSTDIWGLEYAAYDHGDQGELRLVLQYGCTGMPETVEMELIARTYNAENARETSAAQQVIRFCLE